MDFSTVIEIKNLTKKFKSVTAVSDLSLEVHQGDIFGFLGPNGSGKSTTIRMLLTLIRPTSGRIKIFDKDLRRNRREILSKIGAIVEKPDFYLYLSAYKNLEILAKISQISITKRKIMEMLDLVGLSNRADSKVKTFSHGMKQRLGIAQALLHDPQLIIFDEPTTGLDPQGMKEIRDLIIHLSQEQKKTIFLSSHILREIELIATRMIIINKGKRIIEGKVDDLLNSNSLKVSIEVDKLTEAEAVINRSTWNKFYNMSEKNKLIMEMDRILIPELIKYLVSHDIAIIAVYPIRSLEDYFLRITEENPF